MKKLFLFILLIVPASMFGMLRRAGRLRTALKRVAHAMPRGRKLIKSIPVITNKMGNCSS